MAPVVGHRPWRCYLRYSSGRRLILKASDDRSPAPSAVVEQYVVRLASLIKAYAPHDGCFDLRIPGVHVIRRSRTYAELVHGLQQSALCIVAQGAKSVMVGRDVYEYDASRMIVFSVDMPVASQVTRASFSEPFLCLRLDLDPQEVAKLVLKVYPRGLPPVHESRGANFSQPMKVEGLAKLANMSVSSFHQHFKIVTSMSPLQYQKVLRLQEARRLMMSSMMDAGTANRHVGYVSASQFSREYGRFFGSTPTKDIARLREQVGAAAGE